ncbi:MAG: NTP transferase domain-containing protein [Phycisphaerales bacterium]
MPRRVSGVMTPSAIILAAGKGTRMASDLPKVCHPVAGRPMVSWVVDACLSVGCDRVVAVVGYKQDLVREALAEFGTRVAFAVQDEQRGTGHAVRCALPALDDEPEATPVFVLCGDGPLIRTETLEAILRRHGASDAAATLATALLEDPSGYGRIVRDDAGGFLRIVEQKNASPAELAVREVNPSYYCFRLDAMRWGLGRIAANELTGEEYITDLPELLRLAGRSVSVIEAVPAEDVLSINTPEHLAEVDRVLRARLARAGDG